MDFIQSYLSRERPHAMTDTFSGSPMGRNISGRKIPELPISTHFLRPAYRDAIITQLIVIEEGTIEGIGKVCRPRLSKVTFMIAEDFHAGFSVGVVCWLEAEFLNTL